MQAIILGCGVSGLSTGIRFLESDPTHNTAEIWARDLPPNTTSNIAAAIWYPYRAFPFARVLAWGKRTLDIFYDLASDPTTGIMIQEAIEYFSHPAKDPWWRSSVRTFRYLEQDELTLHYKGGYRFETVVIETSKYLPYLIKRFEALGGTIHRREIASIDEATAQAPIVFNCTGLGSRELLNDKEMFPVRGQVIRAGKITSPIVYLDDEEDNKGVFAYIVPRSEDTILGGTASSGVWSLDADAQTAFHILQRCEAMNPEVTDLPIYEHKVGLRPGRASVRLEPQKAANGTRIIHNYGHGGAGVTLSWGCAEEAVALAKR
ncbi:MAG: FAD-dependent oxidoreductase [Chloroflexia bacterium]